MWYSLSDHPTSIFWPSILRLDACPQEMLDPTSIETFGCDPVRSLSILADRGACSILSEFTCGSSSWGLHWEDMASNSAVSGASFPNDEERCATLSSRIKHQAAWFFEKPNATPRGPVWRFARELGNILCKCEQGLPQRKRLTILQNIAKVQYPSERVLDPISPYSRAMKAAESSVFRSSVLEAVAFFLRTPEYDSDVDDEVDLAELLDASISAPWFSTASPEVKAQALGSVFGQRLADLQARIEQTPTRAEFLGRVMAHWLHIVKASEELPQVANEGLVALWRVECPYALGNDNFHESILEMLPDILNHVRPF